MAALRSVLFVDFDSIFGGLMDLDRTSFVVRGLSLRGVRLSDDPPPSAETMREAFQANVVDRYEATGSTLSATQLAEVDHWFRGQSK